MLRRLFVKIGLDSGDTVERIKGVSKEVDKAKAEFEKFGGKSSGAMRELSKASGVYVDNTGKLRDASGRFTKLKSDIDSTKTSTDNLKMAFSGLAAIGIGAAIVGVGSSILRVGINFQAQMSQVAAATNALPEDLAAMTNEARRLGATTTFSATEAAEAMTELGKAGLNTKQIMVGTNSVLQLAGAGQLGLAEATTIASDTMSGFGLQAEDMGRIADVMAKGANASTISVQMMGETFKYVSGVAKAANVSLEETAAMTAILGNAGIKGSMAGTTLKTMLLELSDVKKINLMKSIGVNATENGKLRKVSDILGDLNEKTKNMGNQKKLDLVSRIFGSESAAGVIALLDKGKTGIDEMTDVMRKSGGSAADFAKKANANIKGMLKSLNSIIEEIQLKIFDKLIPLIEPVLSFFTDSERGMARTSLVVGLLATVVGVGLVVAAKAAMVAGYAMLAPYLPIIGIVAGISAALVALYLVFEDIFVFLEYGPAASETFFGEMLSWLGLTESEMQALSDGFKEFKVIMSAAWENLKAFAASPAGQFLIKLAKHAAIAVAAILLFPIAVIAGFAVMSAYIIAKWNLIMETIKSGWKSISEISVINKTISIFTKLANIIQNVAMIVFYIGKIFFDISFFIGNLIYTYWIQPIFQFYAFLVGTLFNALMAVAGFIFKYLISPVIRLGIVITKFLIDKFMSFYDWFYQVLELVTSKISKVVKFLSDLTGKQYKTSVNVSENVIRNVTEVKTAKDTINGIADFFGLEQRALGGPVNAGQPYLVGERGPELVVPRDNGNVIPNNKLAGSGAGNSSNTYHFSVSINSASPEYDAASLVEKVMEFINGENSKSKQRFEVGLSNG